MTAKKTFHYLLKGLFPRLILLIFVIFLCAFLFRNSLAIWLSDFWLAEDTSITCLDFDLGTSPFINIHSMCLESADVEINLQQAKYFVDSSLFSKASYLNQASVKINSLSVSHKQNLQASTVKPAQNNDLAELWALPEMLPLITIEQIRVDSYLMQQPLHIRIFQPNRSELAIRGDVEADLVVGKHQGKGVISGDLNWSASLFLSQSQQLESFTKPYQDYFTNWQSLLDTPIHSHFDFTGSELNSQHGINLNNVMTFEDCKIPVQLSGDIKANLQVAPLAVQVDLSRLNSQFSIKQCPQADAVTQWVKLDAWSIDIPNINTATATNMVIPEINLISSSLQNPLKLTLKDIELNTQMDAKLDYQITLKTAATDLLVEQQLIDAELNIATTGNILKKADKIQLIASNVLEITSLASDLTTIESTSSQLEFSLEKVANTPWKVNGEGKITASEIVKSPLTIHSVSSDFSVDGDTIDQLKINFTSALQDIKYDDFAAKSLASNFTVFLEDIQTISGTGKSKLLGISSDTINLNNIDIKHDINGQIEPYQLTGNHEITLPSGLLANLFHDAQSLSLLVPEQSVTYLNPLLQQIVPELSLVTGELTVNLAKNYDNSDFNGNLTITGLSGEYQDYQIINAQMDAPFKLDSSGIQLDHGKITVEEINVGVPMTQIEAKISMLDNVPKFDFVEARIIGGRVTLADFWLDNRKQLLKLDINDLDLKQLVELQNQEGIEVSGEISGDLPIYWDSGFSNIDQGTLLNDGPGTLLISNNQAFNAIKEQQDQLAFLENVEFSKLSSEVSLSDDGWLDLKIGINGINPDKQQEINFNYSHKENIFTLFKSMRITNSVQNSIEKRIQQRLSNKDKNL
ncbi:YdbH domain-containing protein [Aliiglaciecola sp. SL4]|uniref:YdbH domain-containing protein n=1 Tax=Aliiglaciecola sp. SL4 TaxID=3239806 RepID=UPI00355B4A00